MKRSELVNILNGMEDIEVGTREGEIIGAEITSYEDDDDVNHEYICLIEYEGEPEIVHPSQQ